MFYAFGLTILTKFPKGKEKVAGSHVRSSNPTVKSNSQGLK
jgi:hypothetical protein